MADMLMLAIVKILVFVGKTELAKIVVWFFL
jgi:hypothetical protein